MASSLCLTLMTVILLLTFVSSTISSRTNRKEHGKQDLDGHGDGKLAHAHTHGSHSSVPHMAHMMNKDLPAFKIFFTTDDLKLGRNMQLYFPNRPSSHFLSREEADSIPFSLSKLSNILQILSVSRESLEAEAIENTLRQCESKPVQGETKFCSTSLESMLDFVRSFLGSSSSSSSSVSFHVLSTKIHRSPSQVGVLENYTIVEEPTEIWVPKQVGCHPMSYPYAVFFCHQTRNTKVYKLSLIGELSAEKVEAVAVCHLDTSDWNPDLPAFQVLGTKPGTDPVCHIFPEGNLLWISSNMIAS